MLQSAGLIHGDEIPSNGLMIADLNTDYSRAFFQRSFDEE
jgi:ATP-dependent DNA helicase RecG